MLLALLFFSFLILHTGSSIPRFVIQTLNAQVLGGYHLVIQPARFLVLKGQAPTVSSGWLFDSVSPLPPNKHREESTNKTQ